MNYIDLLNHPPAKEVIDEGKKLTDELAILPCGERKKFINDHDDYWGKLESDYASLSNGKCWYTDAKDVASIYHMDHFRPKNDTKKLKKEAPCETVCNDEAYWWLAFDWENYRYSASIPNTSKNAYFPLKIGTKWAKTKSEIGQEWPGLLDPVCREDTELITFDGMGKVQAAVSDSCSWDAQRVALSIRVYNLNAQPLVDARAEIQQRCEQHIRRFLALKERGALHNDSVLRDESIDEINELRKLIDKKAEFSSVARDYILNCADKQIRKIAFI